MEKQNIYFIDEEQVSTVKHGDMDITVKKYLSVAKQQTLISDYCSTIIDSSIPADMRYLRADLGLMLHIIDTMTDINVEDTEEYVFSVDGLVASGLYKKITEQIDNFEDFCDVLEDSITLTLENHFMNRSIGYKFDSLMDKITDTLDNINSINLDKESIVELITTIVGVQSEFNEKYQIIDPEQDLANALDAVIEEPKPKKRKAKQDG